MSRRVLRTTDTDGGKESVGRGPKYVDNRKNNKWMTFSGGFSHFWPNSLKCTVSSTTSIAASIDVTLTQNEKNWLDESQLTHNSQAEKFHGECSNMWKQQLWDKRRSNHEDTSKDAHTHMKSRHDDGTDCDKSTKSTSKHNTTNILTNLNTMRDEHPEINLWTTSNLGSTAQQPESNTWLSPNIIAT